LILSICSMNVFFSRVILGGYSLKHSSYNVTFILVHITDVYIGVRVLVSRAKVHRFDFG
jgi:hypothetical protein